MGPLVRQERLRPHKATRPGDCPLCLLALLFPLENDNDPPKRVVVSEGTRKLRAGDAVHVDRQRTGVAARLGGSPGSIAGRVAVCVSVVHKVTP
jgi:hypothetical protein